MKIKEFKLERYFAKHEFTAKYLLSSSDCDGFPMQYILDVATEKELALWENLTLGYTESEGDPKLREAILQYYQLNTIENVVVASPGELNFISMNVLLSEGNHVISIAPAYQSLYEVVRAIGCDLSFWKPQNDSWEYEPSDLEALIQPNTKLLIINFPHNPTGAYLSLTQLESIIEIARKHNLTILSDEMYHKLMVSDMPELPPICDLYEKGISLWGTSKTFGLAGLRTGWLVSQDALFLKKVVAFKDYLSICNSATSEILSLIALNHIQDFVQPNIQKIKQNIAHFQSFVERYNIFSNFTPPRAGSAAFVKLNIEGSALEFSDNLVQETGIMTLPSEMFDYDEPYIRVGFGRSNFKKVLGIFGAYLAEQ